MWSIKKSILTLTPRGYYEWKFKTKSNWCPRTENGLLGKETREKMVKEVGGAMDENNWCFMPLENLALSLLTVTRQDSWRREARENEAEDWRDVIL